MVGWRGVLILRVELVVLLVMKLLAGDMRGCFEVVLLGVLEVALVHRLSVSLWVAECEVRG